MNLWNDKDFDLIEDLRKARDAIASGKYDMYPYPPVVYYPRRVGKTRMQERMMKEIKGLNEEIEAKREKRKPSDFLTEDDTLHMAKVQMLTGLQSRNVYRGTVDSVTKQRRRAKNKRARAARRKNR